MLDVPYRSHTRNPASFIVHPGLIKFYRPEQKGFFKTESDGFSQFRAIHEQRAPDVLNPQHPDIEHPVRRLAQLDDPQSVRLATDKVQMGHFGDGVTKGFINSAFRGFASIFPDNDIGEVMGEKSLCKRCD
jgi:hypothetical protein